MRSLAGIRTRTWIFTIANYFHNQSYTSGEALGGYADQANRREAL
jgi:hypothetical protein